MPYDLQYTLSAGDVGKKKCCARKITGAHKWRKVLILHYRDVRAPEPGPIGCANKLGLQPQSVITETVYRSLTVAVRNPVVDFRALAEPRAPASGNVFT